MPIASFDCIDAGEAQPWRHERSEGVPALRAALALLFVAIIAVTLPHASDAGSLRGTARVLDGDSIELDGQRVHILDVDAPEDAQLCFRKAQAIEQGVWPCGREAARALADWIGSRTVTCDTTGRGVRKAWLARCTVAGRDLGEWLAAEGWAVPSLHCKCEIVRDAMDNARASQLGIWLSNFTMPWDWRKTY
jgi:endonuclease YncB( thermonuclease family)